ncbi:hypothetical protein PM082_003882 [Marasmius tenuissimus]|nr:hypothetical protein PM082_003882 [Marasmius tenuissimus]
MTLGETSQTAAENLRECSDPHCIPPLSYEPRRGYEPQSGDIMCIRISALAPFYHLLGDTNSDRGCKPGDRPCVITAIDHRTCTVCLMATFDKNSYEELPALFKEFIILVSTTNPSDMASLNTRLRHVHSTPEWVVPGSGVRGTQYLITLPITVSSKPVKKWRTSDMHLDAGFFLDETTMFKLRKIIVEHHNRSQEWLAENGSMKSSSLLQGLRALENRYKFGNRTMEGDRATLASKRTRGTGYTQNSRLSAGFTPFAKGGTKDVDGFIVVGPDGKQLKTKSRRSRAPSSRAPSTVVSTYGPRRSVLSAFGVVHE